MLCATPWAGCWAEMGQQDLFSVFIELFIKRKTGTRYIMTHNEFITGRNDYEGQSKGTRRKGGIPSSHLTQKSLLVPSRFSVTDEKVWNRPKTSKLFLKCLSNHLPPKMQKGHTACVRAKVLTLGSRVKCYSVSRERTHE